ncbi:MAG TPA: hypothetical protein VFI47_11545 [Acidimicrobiales bacterium]|nr:hypothetical protein [Acidimicrobiales bacterium]
MQISPVTPLDPFVRRDEWWRAVLIVALVVTGVAERSGPGVRGARSVATRPAAPAALDGGAARRHVRPPRSC